MTEAPLYGRRSVQTDQLARVPYCRLTRSANQSILNLTQTPIGFDTARSDPFAMKSGSQIVIRRAGVYRLTAQITWQSAITGDVIVLLTSPTYGTIAIARNYYDGTETHPHQAPTADWPCQVGDAFQVDVYHGAGGAKSILKLPSYSPEFSATWQGNL